MGIFRKLSLCSPLSQIRASPLRGTRLLVHSSARSVVGGDAPPFRTFSALRGRSWLNISSLVPWVALERGDVALKNAKFKAKPLEKPRSAPQTSCIPRLLLAASPRSLGRALPEAEMLPASSSPCPSYGPSKPGSPFFSPICPAILSHPSLSC